MKIIMVNHYAGTLDRAGGTRHHALAIELTKLGHQVLIVSSAYDHFSRRVIAKPTKSVDEVSQSHGISFFWIKTPAYVGNGVRRLINTLAFALRLFFKKRALKKFKPDVIIGSSPHLFGAYAALKLAQGLKVPFVFEVRDIWPESLVILGKISAKNVLVRYMYFLERKLLSQAELVIALLPGFANYLSERQLKIKKLIHIPNFVILNEAANSGSNAPMKANPSIFTFIYAGTHSVGNGLMGILEAVLALKLQGEAHTFQIIFIGNGPEKAKLIAFSQEQALENVRFLAPVPKTEIYELLATADAFIMPFEDSKVYQWGISPNKLFDYMLMTKPVLFFIRPEYNSFKAVNCGITTPHQKEAIMQGIKQMRAADIAERTNWGNNGRNYILQHHSAAIAAKNLEQALLRVIQPK